MECVPETRVEAVERFVGSVINETYLNQVPPDANPNGINLTAVTKEISARWKSLSQEDRITVTTECVQEIEEEREARDLASHNVPLRAFYDARSTVQAVEKQVSGMPSNL